MKTKPKFSIVLLIISISTLSHAQKMRSGIEYKFDVDKINSASSVTWFGWDYSHLILNDANAIAKDIKTKYVPYWYDKTENANFGSKRFQKLFKHKTFINDPRSIQSLVVKIPDDRFIDIYRVPIDIDSVKQIVKNYNVSGDGIGVVSIISEMRKTDITVMNYIVIFDMKTKEILYAIKARGKAGDKGSLQRFYTKGIVLSMKVFFKTY